jgi:hypothetical protein
MHSSKVDKNNYFLIVPRETMGLLSQVCRKELSVEFCEVFKRNLLRREKSPQVPLILLQWNLPGDHIVMLNMRGDFFFLIRLINLVWFKDKGLFKEF